MQTGEAIQKGLGKEVPVFSSSLLGDPDFIISNPQVAQDSFQHYSLVELIQALLVEKTLAGFYPPRLGCSFLLKKMMSNQASNPIWISHDLFICLLTCHLFHILPSNALMPRFLEGLVFSFEEGYFFAYVRGLRTKIEVDAWSGM